MKPRQHPLGTAGLVLSCCTIVPLPVVGGVVGSLLGAAGVRAARRSGGAQSPTTGLVAVGIGLVFGAIPLLVLTAVRADEWSWVPFGIAVTHVAAAAGIASGSRRGAAAGTAGVLGATGLVVAGVFALIAFFVFLGELVWDILF